MKTILAFLLAGCALAAASPVIDDHALRLKLNRHLAEAADRDGHMTGRELADQLLEARKKKLPARLPQAASDGKMNYDDEVKGVVMLGSVRDCGKCEKWHLAGVATGWVLSEDGLIVTNDHVFEEAKREVYGVLTLDGNFAEVAEIVSADRAADIAVIRVKGEGFTPIPLAKNVRVGEPVHVISHPAARYFVYTEGRISRLFKRRTKGASRTWMAITADFARGSSGGPVMNSRGEVVGMVSSTNSIHYGARESDEEGERKQGPLQMVIKNCVSLSALQDMISGEAERTESGEDAPNGAS